MKLVISLATRGRPALLEHTLTQTLALMRHPQTQLVVVADADDAPTVAFLENYKHDRLIASVEPREDTIGAKWNRVLAIPADVYLIMVDYAPHCTPGFDQKVLDAAALFPDGIGVVYSYLANASFPTLNAVTRRLAELTGFIYPEYFPYWFVDHWLDDIGRLIDRIAFADVRVDCHSRRPGTQELREPAFWATLYDAMFMLRRRSAHAIINLPEFQEAPWRKEMLLRHHPLIEYRSQWINSQVRNMAPGLERSIGAGPPDERYTRLKARALAMLPGLIADLEHEQAATAAAA